MKLAIMQPYLFPYIGYYQLMSSVDKFVIYNDVGYIKNGWINRNRILSNRQVSYITVPVAGGSCNSKINMVKIDKSKRNGIKKILATIEQSYKKSDYFLEVFPFIYDVLAGDFEYISDMATESILSIGKKLNLETTFVMTSEEYRNNNLAAENRVIDINIQENAAMYINVEGGRLLYSSSNFKSHGIELKFLHPKLLPYTHVDNQSFLPGLSIIDVAMNNGWNKTREMVNEFELKD